jgi:hypothetical protein
MKKFLKRFSVADWVWIAVILIVGAVAIYVSIVA